MSPEFVRAWPVETISGGPVHVEAENLIPRLPKHECYSRAMSLTAVTGAMQAFNLVADACYGRCATCLFLRLVA